MDSKRKSSEIHFPTDHSKIAKDMVFKFYYDPGRAWLCVPMTLLRELEIYDQISAYSYRQGSHAYLEEDQDAGVFIEAFKKRFGFTPKTKEVEDEMIRNFKRFK